MTDVEETGDPEPIEFGIVQKRVDLADFLKKGATY